MYNACTLLRHYVLCYVELIWQSCMTTLCTSLSIGTSRRWLSVIPTLSAIHCGWSCLCVSNVREMCNINAGNVSVRTRGLWDTDRGQGYRKLGLLSAAISWNVRQTVDGWTPSGNYTTCTVHGSQRYVSATSIILLWFCEAWRWPKHLAVIHTKHMLCSSLTVLTAIRV